MIVALYIFLALVFVGTPLYINHRRYLRNHPESADDSDETSDESTDEQCCGMHITCDKDSLLASVSNEIIYFDDEELDRFAGIAPDSYSSADIEEFREVLLTLLPTDIAPWARSIQLRGIELPREVRDELLLIVAEARAAHSSTPSQY